jgi:hypothetical protein
LGVLRASYSRPKVDFLLIGVSQQPKKFGAGVWRQLKGDDADGKIGFPFVMSYSTVKEARVPSLIFLIIISRRNKAKRLIN